MTADADRQLIERLEREARRNPALYRMRLTVLAVVGDLALTSVQIAPILAAIFFGVVIANYAFFYWIGAAAVVFFVWVMRPSFRVKGRALKEAEAPALFRELAALRERLRVPGRMEVVLDDDFNASAAESLGLLGLVGTRRVLTLGVPLLATLSRDEVRAIIAHEFGHFSRRHGRFGHWLYRARVGWLRYAAYVSESESPLDRAAIRYASRFVPYFSVRSFVHSRQCEYEADADGAYAAGADVFAASLTRLHVAAKLREDRFPRQMQAWQRESPLPPADFHNRFASAARDAGTTEFPALLGACLAERSEWSDTHPALSDRLAALGKKPHLAPPGISAGESLLGESWAAICAEFDAKWARENAFGWALEHFKLKHVTDKLTEVEPEVAEVWPLENRLARAQALRNAQKEKGLEELRSLHEGSPSIPLVAFAYAEALLNEDDAAGVTLMAGALKNNPLYRLPGHERLLAYYERRGDTRQVDRCRALVNLAAQRERKTVTALLDTPGQKKIERSRLAPDIQSALRDSIALDRAVRNAWLLQGSGELEIAAAGTSVPAVIHVLVLTLDPQALSDLGEDESAVRDRYEAAFASLVAPNAIPVVRTFFTTETVPPTFAAPAEAELRPA